MRYALVVGAFIYSLTAVAQNTCEQLVWSDEFEGTEINMDNWSFEIGDGCPNLCGWGNGELQHYTNSPENAYIENGNLVIRAMQNVGGSPEFTSTRLISRGKQSFASGRIEARIKLPQGQGMWPAFWMLPDEPKYGGWPLSGEIDIMEMVGFQPNTTHGTIHYGAMWPSNQYQGNSAQVNGGILADNFHTYSVEWSDEEIRWYFDGTLFSVKTPTNLGTFPWRYDQEYFILLNIAIGGYWPGYPDASTSFPQTMEVDYVRVYQTPEDTFIVGPDFVVATDQSVEYNVPEFDGAEYTWSVQNGTIVSGQGTTDIEVTWEEAEDHEVAVEITYDGCAQTVTREVETGEECKTIFTDFENIREAHWSWFNGGYSEQFVPFQNEVNSSFACAKYTRGTDGASGIRMTLDGIANALDFESGQKTLSIQILSNAPIGTEFKLYLENHGMTNFPGLNGRRSSYSAVTTTQYEWETLYFTFDQVIDMNVSELEINHMTLQSSVAQNLPYVYYLDDLASYVTECLPTSVENISAKTQTFNAYAIEGGIEIQALSNGSAFIFDLNGKQLTNELMQQGTSTRIQLASGVYILNWSGENQTENQKIIVP